MLSVSKPPRYIFEGLRFLNLIETLPPSEVMVLGDRCEFLYCLKRGLRFHWIGYIAKSFDLYIWAGKKDLFSEALLFIQKLFSTQAGDKKYLFLWEDSLPTGLTLSAALESIPGLNVVCISHGMLFRYRDKRILQEGWTCKFNLVWAPSQRKLTKGGDDPATFVLGLPYEVTPNHLTSRNVVLIGHCCQNENTEEYFFSLYHFRKIYTILHRAGFAVSFRPRPYDDINFIRSVFPSVCVDDKHELFASKKMVFIGFVSTMLYEARQFGHIVIGLDTSTFAYERDYDVDGIVLASDYEGLPLYLSKLFDERLKHIDARVESLSSRFRDCIRQIDKFNSDGGRGC